MIFGLDTNVLVRLLVKDDLEQVEAASTRIKDEVSKDNLFYISDLVLLETFWVLESCYDASNENIIEAIEKMMLVAHFQYDDIDLLHRFVRIATESSSDLSDILIGLKAKANNCETTLTFDKRASRLEAFEYLNV